MKTINDIIKELTEHKEERTRELDWRKNEIHNTYILAKHDLLVIENMQDSENTLNKIIDELQELQKRIIKRNEK